ncbi:unnamed protein product [Rotaria sp. Silwood2]|nr:unnamed protein product [Rotaria sp. Silwood2]
MQTSSILLCITLGISCRKPSQYAGQSVCDHFGKLILTWVVRCIHETILGGLHGECVSFVKICTGDRRKTDQWRRGAKVRGSNIASGTAIATFPYGKYKGHAAIYISQDRSGIQVWDQWKGHSVSQRTIRWNGSGLSNNGDSFYVID